MAGPTVAFAGPGNHASRPAANSGAVLYTCTDHGLVYRSDGSSWATWLTLPSAGLSDPMTTRGDIIIRNASNATARLGRGSAGYVLTSDGTDVAWAAPAGAADILDLPTAETDDTLVLAPDGAGGVEFRAEGGGGGGGAVYQLDVPPTSPDADDDEFPGTSLSGAWTDPLTSASGQTNLVDVRDGRLYFEPATSGTSSTGKHVFGIRKASPAGSFTVSAKMMSSHSGDDVRGGLYIGTAGGRGHMVGPSPQDGTAAYIAATTISNSADWSSFDSHSGLAAYYSYFPMWVRIRWDAGATTLYADLSMNGTIWRQVYSRGSMAQPDQMGFAIYSNTGSIPAHAGLAAEWFRVIDGSAAFTPY